MTSKRKSRLKTYDENEIYALFFWTFIFITLSIALWTDESRHFIDLKKCLLIIVLVAYLIISAIIIVKWLYRRNLRRNALIYGERADAYVKAIQSHKTLVHSRNGDYISLEWDLIIEYKFNNRKQTARFGKYSPFDNPGKYISSGDKCNVYIYKGKAYLQDLYREDKKKTKTEVQIEEIHNGKYDNMALKELLKYPITVISGLDRIKRHEAVNERHLFSAVRSKSYLIVEPLNFYNAGKGYILLVEVYISSLIAYNAMDFVLKINLAKYLKKYEMDNIYLNEQILKSDVEQIVNSSIRGSTIQATVKKVETVLLIDYELESSDEKEKNDEQINQLDKDVTNGKYTNTKFEKISYCSAKEIINLKAEELNKACAERRIFSKIKSQEFVVLPPLIFIYPDVKVIYADVFMISPELYCEKDFGLEEKIQDYSKKLFKEFTQYEDSLLKDNIRQLISMQIHAVDSRVEILDIVVEIQSY